MTWQYYIKSKKAVDYRQMIIDSLYHPPEIHVDPEKTKDGILYLNHTFEGKGLKVDYIENTMVGIEYLWGGPVHLETSEAVLAPPTEHNAYTNFWDPSSGTAGTQPDPPKEIQWKRVIYIMENRNLKKQEV